MTIFAYYTSPTTPGATSWSVELSSAIRLASITGIAIEAEAGAVGAGNIVLDDPTSSVGHSGDGIVGLKQFHMIETDCPVGNQRLYTGYVGDRRYYRGKSNSLITGAARVIDITLYDINAFLAFRVFAPVALDPTSSFVRPAETDLARIEALLDVDFLSDTLFDIGYIPTTGGIAMDANDYTGSHPGDVLNSCAQASGRNYFVLYDETTGKYVLWYDKWTTDGTSTIVFDSPLSLTNVLSEASASAGILLTAFPGDTEVTLAWTIIPGATTFVIEPDAVETIDPSRVVSAVYLPYTGGTAYETLPSTANTFAWRDAVAPSVTVKTLAKANALAIRYLADNATEDNRIALTVQLPSSAVTLLREGMRVQLHATHLPNVSAGFTWCRILQRTIRQDQATPSYYWVDLEVSVPPVVCAGATPAGTYGPLNGNVTDAQGVEYYGRPGVGVPATPDPGHVGDWAFPSYGTGGSPDCAFNDINQWRIMVVGPGTLTVHTAVYAGGVGATFTVIGGGNYPLVGATPTTYPGVAATDVVIVIPAYSPCLSVFDVGGNDPPFGVNICAAGVTWVPA